jgi:hypothetical protein
MFRKHQTKSRYFKKSRLQSENGKSFISKFEEKRDAQSVFRELKNHASGSNAAQLLGYTLSQYNTAAKYPGTWRGSLFKFVLHWKEKVMEYKTLKLEEFPSKQKLRMLQNAFAEVSELAYVKPIGDQDIAPGNQPLVYETYMELLLSACSTFDK